MSPPAAGGRRRLVVCAALGALLAGSLHGQQPTRIEEIVVTSDLRGLLGEGVQSVLGFDKSILETPRSASTVSEDVMDRFNMRDIDDLIAIAPGTFTQSFFGRAGVLDVRGTPGEAYFRGMRRLDNPGNYPVAIGAADRIDVVRGPASPVFGPSKIGGYLNYYPKSARIEETGQFAQRPFGGLSLSTGSWDEAVLSAEVGGPGNFGGREFGYFLYGELEDSGSYYDDTGTRQSLLQASMDMDLAGGLRIQMGGMWHDFASNQVAGWNRLTQDLVDHGIYVTGRAKPLDLDGDGRVSHQEYDTDGDGFTNLEAFRFDALTPGLAGGELIPGGGETYEELEALTGDLSALNLIDPGVARIEGSTVLVAPEDTLENETATLYFDLISADGSGWSWRNQLFFERYDNLNENAYGFSQFHDTWVVENKFVLSREFALDGLTAAVQISPSARHTDFEHADDYTNEHFHRRDLTRPADALSRRVLATRIHDDYTEYYIGKYTDLGLAVMADFSWDNGISLLAGARHDSISMESRQPADQLLFASSNHSCPPPGGCEQAAAEDDVDGVSWTFSLSYESAAGLVPYLTASRQSTIIAGQGGEVTTSNILSGGAFDSSKLLEAGLKGSLLDNRLYFALARYEQERTDFSAQSIVTNQSTRTRGSEAEAHWAVTDRLLLTFAHSHIEVVNLETERNGYRFSFIGCEDLPAIPCHLLYGGTVSGFVSAAPSGGRRAGMPEDILSASASYEFDGGWTASVSVADVAAVPSGFSNSVILPSYTLVNAGVGYEAGDWRFSVSGENLTDERYFRSNFPNLFGGVIVLPELPRHFSAQVRYRF